MCAFEAASRNIVLDDFSKLMLNLSSAPPKYCTMYVVSNMPSLALGSSDDYVV